MGTLAAGTVIITPFPFSNLQTKKLRPAVVLATGDFGDVILCQITSYRDDSKNTVLLTNNSFSHGSLERVSYARPDKLFTCDPNIFVKTIGTLNHDSLSLIKAKLAQVLDL